MATNGNGEHPAERTKDKAGKDIPQLACPRCGDHPGRVVDRDGGGAYYVDCPDCHGTGKVPDMAVAARAAEAATAAAPPVATVPAPPPGSGN